MIVIPTVTDLSLLGVADPGVPNKERIVLRPAESIELGHFALLVGTPLSDGTIFPLRNLFFWFGPLEVGSPSWIYLYTGPGTYQRSHLPGTDQAVYVFHWHQPHILFGDASNLVPVLVQLGAVGFGGPGPTVAPMSAAEMLNLIGKLPPAPFSYPNVFPPPPKTKP